MSTFIREPFPEAKKLSKANVAMWTHYMQYKMMDWSDLGSAIQFNSVSKHSIPLMTFYSLIGQTQHT
jgi:hypothetical protein